MYQSEPDKEREKIEKQSLPKPMKWYKFTIYINYPFTFLQILILLIDLIRFPVDVPFVLTTILVLTAVNMAALKGLVKFQRYGVIIHILFPLLTTAFAIICCLTGLLYMDIEALSGILSILIVTPLEAIYFYKRRHLFGFKGKQQQESQIERIDSIELYSNTNIEENQ